MYSWCILLHSSGRLFFKSLAGPSSSYNTLILQHPSRTHLSNTFHTTLIECSHRTCKRSITTVLHIIAHSCKQLFFCKGIFVVEYSRGRRSPSFSYNAESPKTENQMNSVRRAPSTACATEAWATDWKQHAWTLSRTPFISFYHHLLSFLHLCAALTLFNAMWRCGQKTRPETPCISLNCISGFFRNLLIASYLEWNLMTSNATSQGALWCLPTRSSGRRDVHLPAAGSQGYGLGSGGSGGISRLQASMQSISVPVISGLFFLFCVKLRLKAMMCGHETLKPLPVSLWVCQPNVAPKWPRLLCIRLSYLRRKYVLSKSTMNIIIPDQTHRFVLLISIMWTQASTL